MVKVARCADTQGLLTALVKVGTEMGLVVEISDHPGCYPEVRADGVVIYRRLFPAIEDQASALAYYLGHALLMNHAEPLPTTVSGDEMRRVSGDQNYYPSRWSERIVQCWAVEQGWYMARLIVAHLGFARPSAWGRRERACLVDYYYWTYGDVAEGRRRLGLHREALSERCRTSTHALWRCRLFGE